MKLTFLRAFDQFVPADDQTIEWFINLDTKEYVHFDIPDNQRTAKQNSAIRVYCREVSEALNEAGYDMKSFPWKEGFALPWSEYTVMEYLWRQVQVAMTGKESSTKLDTKEVGQVYEVLARKLAEVAAINVPFPSKDQ
jgi:hypothetical protein